MFFIFTHLQVLVIFLVCIRLNEKLLIMWKFEYGNIYTMKPRLFRYLVINKGYSKDGGNNYEHYKD